MQFGKATGVQTPLSSCCVCQMRHGDALTFKVKKESREGYVGREILGFPIERIFKIFRQTRDFQWMRDSHKVQMTDTIGD